MTDENGIEVSDYIAVVQPVDGAPAGYEILISAEDDSSGSQALLSAAITGCVMHWNHPDRYAHLWAPDTSTALAAFYAFREAGITVHKPTRETP